MTAGKRVIVHNAAHARATIAAAEAAGRPVTLVSAPGAAAYLGGAYFREMISQAGAGEATVPVTAVLDCGDAIGYALGALHDGVPSVRVDASAEALGRIADIAAQMGATLDQDDAPALDLLGLEHTDAALSAWFAAD